ncbi:hypothetical protein EI94DRAFT_1702533 [Lactarius quietus]|nr:hypothetical protein EI94DRAFT_1702533 [Lactarius quietus]
MWVDVQGFRHLKLMARGARIWVNTLNLKVMGGCARLQVNTLSEDIILSELPKLMAGHARLQVNTLSEPILSSEPQSSWVDVQGFGQHPVRTHHLSQPPKLMGHDGWMCKASGQYLVRTHHLSKPPKLMGGCARLWVNIMSNHILCSDPQRSWVDVQGFGSIPCLNTSTVQTPEAHGWMSKVSGQYPVGTHHLSEPSKLMAECARLWVNTLSEHMNCPNP